MLNRLKLDSNVTKQTTFVNFDLNHVNLLPQCARTPVIHPTQRLTQNNTDNLSPFRKDKKSSMTHTRRNENPNNIKNDIM